MHFSITELTQALLRIRTLTLTLALFDLDNTLLNGDSDHGWGIFLAKIGVLDPVEQQQKQDYYYQQYLDGALDMHEFLTFQLKPLGEHPKELLHQWRAQYIDEVIEPLIESGKANLLEPHRAEKHTIVIITATNDFITRPIADRLGVETLLSTRVEVQDGQYTGSYTGIPCYHAGKVAVLREWLVEQDENLEGSYFYSDSINDLPLLELVTTPIAVTPDSRLRAHATKMKWQIID